MIRFAAGFILGIVAAALLVHILQPAPSTVLLSFDTELVDSPEMVGHVLDVLEKYNATATFFVMGAFAEEHPALTKRISERHEVACHTMTHPRLGKLNESDRLRELSECRRVVAEITGKEVLGFRAPYNLLDRKSARLLGTLGYEYDASAFENYGLLFPDPDVPELAISSWGIVPLEDYALIHTLRLGSFGFWMMRQDKGEIVSLAFHPRFAQQKGFERLVSHYAEHNATFATHESMLVRP